MTPYYFIMGLGRSGLTTARWLVTHGHDVVAWDDNLVLREAAQKDNVTVADPLGKTFPWERVSILVLSPGIPMLHPKPHPAVVRAQEKVPGIEIINDMELFIKFKGGAPIIGVTGTNGKSTTTACLGEILQSVGQHVAVAGNIGIPVFAFDPKEDRDGYVWEISSYQLESMASLHPQIAVITNLTPDHLDRYESLEAYYRTKENILQNMSSADWLVIGIDSPGSLALFKRLQKTAKFGVFPISVTDETSPMVVAHGCGIYKDKEDAFMLVPKEKKNRENNPPYSPFRLFGHKDHPTLKGVHNVQNRACAFGAGFLFGPPYQELLDGLEAFVGLRHRSEYITHIQGVCFVNDSKATNIDAALKAVGSYESLYWILGGQYKGDDITQIFPLLPRVKEVFLIGESMDIFERELGTRVSCRRSYTLDRAIKDAFKEALQTISVHKGEVKPVILLSPACASFDQFRNFEERGDVFRDTVMGLRDDEKEKERD